MDKGNHGDKSLKVLELFTEGKAFTEELLKENENLRLVVAKLKNEKKDLEKKYIQVDVPRMREKLRMHEDELNELRKENKELRGQFESVEEENREFAGRYVQVERQNSALINLYVASYRLHSTLNYTEVVEIVKEIVINMVGSEVFGVYVVDEEEKEMVMIAHEGLENQTETKVALGQGRIGEAGQSGDNFVAPAGTDLQVRSEEPIACISLKVGERTMGVIAIYQLMMQKEGFHELDYQLFELLGAHAATAIYAAKLFTLSERKRNTLEGFINLMKMDTDVTKQ